MSQATPPSDRVPMRRRLWRIVGIGVGVLLLLIVAQQVDWNEFARVTANAKIEWLLAVLLTSMVDRLWMAGKWHYLLRRLGVAVRLIETVAVYHLGVLIGLAAQWQLGGDIARTVRLARETSEHKKVLFSVVFEKICGFSGSAIAAIAATVLLNRIHPFMSQVVLVAVAVPTMLALAAASLLMASPVVLKRVAAFRPKMLAKLGWNAGGSPLDDVGPLRTAAVVFFVLTVTEQIMPIVIISLTQTSLDIDVGFWQTAAVVSIVTFFSRLPVVVEGIGVYEGLTVVLFGILGMTPAEAFALAIVSRVVGFLSIAIGTGVSTGARRFVARSERGSATVSPASASERDDHRGRLPRSKPILCIGHAFARNYGDRAIFNVLKAGLAEAGLLARPFPIKPVCINRQGHLMSPSAKLFRGLLLLPAHYLRLWRRARGSSAVLIGAGNPMMDIHPLHAVQFLFTCLVVRAAGRRFWIFGGGAGPLRTRLGRLCVSAACHLAESVTVRDTASASALEQCPGMVNIVDRKVVPDLVFGQVFPPRQRAPGAPLTLGIAAIHHMRPNRSPEQNAALYEAYVGRLETLVRLAVAQLHAHVVVFTNEPMEDQQTVDDLMARVRDLPGVRSVAVNSVRGVISVTRSCDLHVGGRLHSVIFSLAQGVPAIALNSHAKIAGLYADLQAHDLVFDIGNFDPAGVMETLIRVQGERGRTLMSNVARLREASAAGLAEFVGNVHRYVQASL